MLEIKNLSTNYGQNQILNNISFSLEYGKAISILGANGCGKTTLMRCIASQKKYTGTITIDNKDIQEMKPKELSSKVAVLEQISSIYFPYTVYETVMMGRYQKIKNRRQNNILKEAFNFNTPTKQDKEFVEQLLINNNLIDIKDRPITCLSGGQLQRVFLAKTLAQEPSIILLDEPSNHLDLKHQVELIDYLNKWIKKENHSVIGVFHDINLALRLSNNVLFIHEHQIKAQGDFFSIASSNMLNDIYKLDVKKYMINALGKWESIE